MKRPGKAELIKLARELFDVGHAAAQAKAPATVKMNLWPEQKPHLRDAWIALAAYVAQNFQRINFVPRGTAKTPTAQPAPGNTLRGQRRRPGS